MDSATSNSLVLVSTASSLKGGWEPPIAGCLYNFNGKWSKKWGVAIAMCDLSRTIYQISSGKKKCWSADLSLQWTTMATTHDVGFAIPQNDFLMPLLGMIYNSQISSKYLQMGDICVTILVDLTDLTRSRGSYVSSPSGSPIVMASLRHLPGK